MIPVAVIFVKMPSVLMIFVIVILISTEKGLALRCSDFSEKKKTAAVFQKDSATVLLQQSDVITSAYRRQR